jgi:F-type H+-transporting ATPase subunit b
MLIDWFTVGAQLLNFIVLVWLLKRFLYRPILRAIDMREKRVAAELADADRQRAEVQKARDEFQEEKKTFGIERGALLAKATLDAKLEGERLLNDARKAADCLLLQRQTAMHNDAVTMGHELTRRAAAEIFAIARKALTDLAGADLEERLAEVFMRRLQQLDAKTKATLGASLKNPDIVAVLRSSFDLPSREQATIQNALNETFSANIRLRFETDSEGSCGIELTAGGQRLSWNIADYLKSLEEMVGVLLNAASASAGGTPVTGALTTANAPKQPVVRSPAGGAAALKDVAPVAA